MIKNFLLKNKTTIVVAIETALFVLALWLTVTDMIFIMTKKSANGQIISVEQLREPKPYKIKVRYFNTYTNKYIISSIDEIDGIYGKGLPSVNNYVKIYFSRESPQIIYLADYKYPNVGYIIIYFCFMAVMALAVFFQLKMR